MFPDFTNCDDVVAKSNFSSPLMMLWHKKHCNWYLNVFNLQHRLVLDHLTSGKYHSVSDAHNALEVASMPKTNIAPERDFAVLNRLLSENSNATYIALESLLLYSQNQTTKWL